jgi:hypothetical protein
VGRDRRPARAGRARLRRALLVTAAVVLLTAACDGGASDSRPSPTTSIANPTPIVTFAPSGDPGAVVEQLVLACREKDVRLVRSFLVTPVSEAEIEALFALGDDVVLRLRAPAEFDGDRASVDVRLEIRRGGQIDTVERTWRLARGDDGIWRFTDLPDCY